MVFKRYYYRHFVYKQNSIIYREFFQEIVVPKFVFKQTYFASSPNQPCLDAMVKQSLRLASPSGVFFIATLHVTNSFYLTGTNVHIRCVCALLLTFCAGLLSSFRSASLSDQIWFAYKLVATYTEYTHNAAATAAFYRVCVCTNKLNVSMPIWHDCMQSVGQKKHKQLWYGVHNFIQWAIAYLIAG